MENGSMMKLKHLSTVANDVLCRCTEKLGTSVDVLVDEFQAVWNPEKGSYSRKLVEYCCTKALRQMCCRIEESITDGSFSRFAFDMMLALQAPSSTDDESYMESVGKEREDRKLPVKVTEEHEDVPLFYSDIMPLLVDHGVAVQEDAFLWLVALVPLPGDIVNGRFTFETLTTPTANQLYYPAYDKYLKEIDKCIRHLQKQSPPKGVELADDEFILHVEGTSNSQRVVRHIGGTSWPGRLTLTNYALYFEASGTMSYEDALKINLSENTEQSVKPAATGPFGAPLFDKAIIYQSAELPEGVILEFPEVASSTRRDHWLSLTKEIILLHQFLKDHKIEASVEAWEIHARTILGIVRLHAVRELLRMAPPIPKSFLIFTLLDELPKGDYVLEELARSLKQVDCSHPCSASSILRSLNMPHDISAKTDLQDDNNDQSRVITQQEESMALLESKVNEAREEAKEIETAKATADRLRDEGISDSALVLLELLSPVKKYLYRFQEVLKWEKPSATVMFIAAALLIAYKEWIGKAIAFCLLWAVKEMFCARKMRIKDKYDKLVVYTGSDQSTVESIVSAQHGLIVAHEMLQTTNITILKILSIVTWRAEKHAKLVTAIVLGLGIVLLLIPFKFVIIGVALYTFTMTSSLGKSMTSERSNRRLREWWDSIPIIPVEIVDKPPNADTGAECTT
ncbi:hypothetical protein Dimus_034920 [Dionaea muscipula]